MPVNECSLYRHSKPLPFILSREEEEVAFQVLNGLRASTQSSLRNSHRILNYCYWAFPHSTGAQISFLTNAFSSQESRGCSACPWAAAITFCRARDSSTRHLQTLQSLCWACPIHMLCRQNGPDRFLCFAGWAQRKTGHLKNLCLFCVWGWIWASTTYLAEIFPPFVLSWVQTPLLTACGNVSGQTMLSTCWGL